MKIILLGAPGSGKGTQASFLEKNKNFFRLSPGDLLREELRKNTDLSFKIKDIISKGRLIDNQIIFDLVEENLFIENILFDGYPRTLEQAFFLCKKNINIDLIINLDVSQDLILKRIKYRMVTRNSSIGFSLLLPCNFQIRYKDNYSGLKFFKRIDDRYATIFKRLFYYNEQKKILIDYYLKKNVPVLNLDGNQDINSVYMSVETYINKIHKKND